nr:VWA domain-containing protein [Paenibacillus hamazuiensis]
MIPWAGFVVWAWRSRLSWSSLRRRWAVGLRALLLLLLIAALAGMQWFESLQQRAVVYVADRSYSMPADSKTYDAWLQASAAAKAKDDRVGVVTAGGNAIVERSLTADGLGKLAFNGQVNREFTNLAQGLGLAAGLLPQDASPRLVLMSDGQENTGDLLREARLLKDKGIPVDVLPIPAAVRRDVAIESLKLPQKLYQAEKYTLEVQLKSTYAGTGELRVYEDNREISSQTVTVERGDNRFALQSLAREPGFHRYRAEIYFPNDEQAANNADYAFSRVSGPPKVLVVEGTPGSSTNVEAVLKSGLIGCDTIPPEMLPREMADYTGYDSIVLNNVPATRISGPQMDMIEKAVKDHGVGLIMTGGEDSFGMGGYFKTPIERALPVSMELEGKREIPSLGLILVIDRSGSMSGDKIELAKEAAMRTVELMREKDTVGVVAFDSSPWWVVEPQKLTDKKKVTGLIQGIQPDGGTEIYTAVEEAYQRLLKVDAQRKHIILLTDGQSATNQSYEQLAGSMVQNKMTLSSVAVGEGADVQLLEKLAKLAKGRFYYTNDQTTLPAIFSREAVMMARTYIVDKPFVPALGQPGDWGELFRQGVPKINAYVATTPKQAAEVALTSPEPDPLLARWQYGSGRAVAWTSDVTGKWSKDWVEWNAFSSVFSHILKWTFPQFQAAPFELTSRLGGSEVTLGLKSGSPDPTGEIRVSVTDEALQTENVQVTPTAPGEYEAKMSVAKPGVYLAKIDVPGNKDQAGGSVTAGFVLPYSPEYRLTPGDGAAKLKQLAELTGGRLLSLEHPEAVFQGKIQPKRTVRDLTLPLLMLAVLVWLADIAVRRLSVPWARLSAAAAAYVRGRRGPAAPAADNQAAAAAMERLRRRTREAGASRRGVQAGSASLLARGQDAAGRELPRTDAAASAPRAGGGTPAAAGDGGDRAGTAAKPQAPQPQAAPAPGQPAETGEQARMDRLLAAKNRRKR